MKALFINACVRRESRTALLCTEYMAKHWQNAEVTELDLNEMKLAALDRAGLARRSHDEDAAKLDGPAFRLAHDFAEADEILIGAPYWDCSFPALLKIYLEHVCVTGVTFGYGEDGTPVGLCRAGKLTYITTAGGYLPEPSSVELHMQELCHMLGINTLEFHKAEGLDIQGNDVTEILDRALEEL